MQLAYTLELGRAPNEQHTVVHTSNELSHAAPLPCKSNGLLNARYSVLTNFLGIDSSSCEHVLYPTWKTDCQYSEAASQRRGEAPVRCLRHSPNAMLPALMRLVVQVLGQAARSLLKCSCYLFHTEVIQSPLHPASHLPNTCACLCEADYTSMPPHVRLIFWQAAAQCTHQR